MQKELFAIFGNPVSHSRSPLMHNRAFSKLGFAGCYGRYLLENGKELKSHFLALGLRGANITVPHKEEAFNACDELDSFAKRVGAVNTIVLKNDKLYGYNTDALGFLRVIEELKSGKSILFLGAGGTASSSAVILKDAGYNVTILNRSKKRLEQFKNQGFTTAIWQEFTPKYYDLVVNMTSAGLNDDNLPAPKDILEALFKDTKAVVDVIYGKETPFLKLAKEFKLPIKDGSDMLLYQGVLAFDLFTNGIFEFKAIEEAMRESFLLN